MILRLYVLLFYLYNSLKPNVRLGMLRHNLAIVVLMAGSACAQEKPIQVRGPNALKPIPGSMSVGDDPRAEFEKRVEGCIKSELEHLNISQMTKSELREETGLIAEDCGDVVKHQISIESSIALADARIEAADQRISDITDRIVNDSQLQGDSSGAGLAGGQVPNTKIINGQSSAAMKSMSGFKSLDSNLQIEFEKGVEVCIDDSKAEAAGLGMTVTEIEAEKNFIRESCGALVTDKMRLQLAKAGIEDAEARIQAAKDGKTAITDQVIKDADAIMRSRTQNE